MAGSHEGGSSRVRRSSSTHARSEQIVRPSRISIPPDTGAQKWSHAAWDDFLSSETVINVPPPSAGVPTEPLQRRPEYNHLAETLWNPSSSRSERGRYQRSASYSIRRGPPSLSIWMVFSYFLLAIAVILASAIAAVLFSI